MLISPLLSIIWPQHLYLTMYGSTLELGAASLYLAWAYVRYSFVGCPPGYCDGFSINTASGNRWILHFISCLFNLLVDCSPHTLHTLRSLSSSSYLSKSMTLGGFAQFDSVYRSNRSFGLLQTAIIQPFELDPIYASENNFKRILKVCGRWSW